MAPRDRFLAPGYVDRNNLEVRTVIEAVLHSLRKLPNPDIHAAMHVVSLLVRVGRTQAFTTVMVAVAVAADLFLYNSLIPVLPFIMEQRLHMTTYQVQRWTGILLTIYAAAFLAMSLPFGIWNDRAGSRRLPLLTGIILTWAAVILFCVSDSCALFAVARFFQGCSSACIWVTGLAIVLDSTGPQHIGMAMGWIMASYSLSGMVSPLIVGALYQRQGMTKAIGLVVAFVACDFICRLVWCASYAHGSKSQETSPAAVSTARTTRCSTLRVLLRTGRLWTACLANLMIIIVLTALDTTLVIRVQTSWGWGPTNAGLMFLILQAPGFFGGPSIGWMVDRIGAQKVTCVGLALTAPACFLISRDIATVAAAEAAMIVAVVIIGLSASLVITALMAEFGHICQHLETSSPGIFGHRGAYAHSYGFFTASMALGICVGSSSAQGIINSRGWTFLFVGLAVLTIVTTVLVLLPKGITTIQRWLARRGRLNASIHVGDRSLATMASVTLE